MSTKRIFTLFMLAIVLLLATMVAVACDNTDKATVYFDADADTPLQPVTRAIGEPFGELPTPTRKNHVFEGWFADKDCKTAVDEKTVVAQKSITLYALWTFRLVPETKTQTVCVEYSSCYTIDDEGKLYEWGIIRSSSDDELAEYGDYRCRPKHIATNTRFRHTGGMVALDVDGNIWYMSGNPADPSIEHKPTQLTSGTQFVQVEHGINIFSDSEVILAVDSDGDLWEYYNKRDSELRRLTGSGVFASISVYEMRRYAVDKNGKLWAWGDNRQGLLGDGTKKDPKFPINIAEGVSFVAVSASLACTYAIDREGHLWSWGVNGGAMLGDGTRSDCFVPKAIRDDTRFVSLSGSSFALDVDGGLWGWGGNAYGLLVDSTTEDRVLSPKRVMPEKKFSEVSCDSLKVLAVDYEGNVWSWGSNTAGQRGDGTGEEYFTPYKVEQTTPIVAIDGNGEHAFKIDSDGTLWGVGSKIGNGEKKNQTSYIAINKDVKYKQVYAAFQYAVAIDIDGNLWSWGSNDNGQLGNGTQTEGLVPTQITHGTEFVQVSPGSLHSLAIDKNGKLWAWGNKLSYASTKDDMGYILTPTQIIPDKTFVKAATWSVCSLMIDTDGYLWACGTYPYKQTGLATNSSTLQKVSETVKFKDISAGPYHVLAIDIDGNLWAWGTNIYEQDGKRVYNTKSTPVQITQNIRFTKISAGEMHSLALDEQGNLWAWGENFYGRLGDGTMKDATAPKKINTEAKFVEIVAADGFSMGLDNQGNVYYWGRNTEFDDGAKKAWLALDPIIVSIK